jgi:hypothetical protein
LPQTQAEAERVAAFYSRERFGARQLDAVERATLTNAWRAWCAAWWRGVGRRIVNSVVVPTRNLIVRMRAALERWNNRASAQS